LSEKLEIIEIHIDHAGSQFSQGLAEINTGKIAAPDLLTNDRFFWKYEQSSPPLVDLPTICQELV